MDSPPDPPDGYGSPEAYDEGDTWVHLTKILCGVMLGVIAWWMVGYSVYVEATIHSVSSPIIGGIMTMLVFLTSVVFLPAHEYLHAVVNRWYGYNPQTTWEFPNPNVTVRGEFVQRSHSMVALLAPLVIISPTSFAIAQLVSNPLIALFFGSVFILNTVGSGGDLYNAWSLYRQPRGTCWYMPSEGMESYVYPLKS
ncbi:DUF3267 domain-containing protein [Halostagnicola bangensis]